MGTLHGQIEFKGTKRPKSRREMELRAWVVAALREHKIRHNERRLELGPLWTDYDLVFTNAHGGPIDPNNVDRDFERLVKKAGVKRIRIHDCRHSYATLALSTGEHIKVVSETLGHADIAITLRTYAHVMPEQKRALADKMEALLLGARPEEPSNSVQGVR